MEIAEQDSFYSSHMTIAMDTPSKFNDYTFYSQSSDTWIADSGASAHVANRREMFTSFTPYIGTLNVAGGLTAEIKGIGIVHMQGVIDGKLKFFKLKDVLYVPATSFCLISESKLDKAGGMIKRTNGICKLWNFKRELMATGTFDGNLYHINAKAVLHRIPIANVVSTKTVSWHDAHRRMGHISLSSLKLLFEKQLVDGIKIDERELVPSALRCESCILAKAHRIPFPKNTEKHSKSFGDLIPTDVWGSPNIKQTPGGNQYFVLFVDDHTRYISVNLMKDKASVKQKLMNYCSFVHTQYNRWPKEIRADNAAEYEETKSWLEERGIQLKPSAPYSPQQNGVSERMNRTLLELARAMIIEKKMLESLWGEAVLHASWIRNRSPTAALSGQTPYGIMYGNRPDLSDVREFGEEVYVFEEISGPKTGVKAQKCEGLKINCYSQDTQSYVQES